MLNSTDIKKLYIRESNWIGDAVMTLPTLKAIREHLPNTHITIGAKGSVVSILESCGYADDFITIPHPAKGSELSKKWKLLRSQAKRGFDAAILFTNSFESALEVFMMGIPTRIGYARDGRGFLLTDKIAVPANINEIHEVRYFANILTECGISVKNPELSLKLSKEDISFAETFFREKNLSGRFVAVIHTGTSTKERSWHYERYADVCNHLCEKYDAAIIFTGGKDDVEGADRVSALLKGDKLNLAGEISIGKTAAIIQKSTLFIGNDSGPMHIASALKTPLVVIFGPGNDKKTHPFTSPELYAQVKNEFPCRPCKQRFFKECTPAESGKPECIESIKSMDVTDACDKIIDSLNLAPDKEKK